MISLRGLECLVTIVEQGSMTKAATVLHMSQPALSHQIAAIERQLGVAVIERVPRGVRPTAAGAAVVGEARIALSAADKAVTAGRRVAAGTAGRVRIACAETMTGWLLVPVIRSWRRRFPEVELDLKEYTSADRMLEVLLAGGADIAVTPSPTRTDEHVELLGEEEMVVVASPDHRFAAMDAVPLSELADEPLVHYDRSNGIASWVDRFAAERDVVLPRPTLRTGSPRTAAQLAAAGIGVAIVPISALTPPPYGTVRSLDPPELRDVIVVIAAPHDNLVARFVADLKRRGLPSARLAAGRLDGRARITAVPPAPGRVRAGGAALTLPDDAGLAGLTVRAGSGGARLSLTRVQLPAVRAFARHERKGPLCPSDRSSSSMSTRPSWTSRRSGQFSTGSSTTPPPCGCGSRT